MPEDIQKIFPGGVVVVGGPIADWQGELHPREAEIIRSAAVKRQREFTAGRLCAHEALCRLGLPYSPLLAGKDKVPLWPPAVVGSLTHSDDYCAAAVAWRSDYSGLGLDVEPAEPLGDELLDTVCTVDERALIKTLPEEERQLWARVVFSAKESVYKCVFPITRVFLDFHDIRIIRVPATGRFSVELLRPSALTGDSSVRLIGRYTLKKTHLFTAVSSKA